MSIFKKLAWSCGSIAGALSMQAFSTFIYFFYMDHLGLSKGLVGLGMVIYAVWNAINDPLLGQLSDRTRTRLGRRIPYVLFGAIPLGLAFTMIWTPPAIVRQGTPRVLFAYFLGSIFIFDGLYSLVLLNWTALFPEMFRTDEERAQMAVIRQVFSIIGLVVGVALPPVLYGQGKGSVAGWTTMGILLGAVTAVTLLISVLGSRERPEFSQEEPLRLFRAVKATLRNRSFLTFAFANMAVNFSFIMLTAAFPFYSKYVLGVEGFSESLLLGAIFASALVAMPVWGWVVVRIGPRLTMGASAVIFAVGTLPFLVAHNFTSGLFTSLLLGLGLSGLIMVTEILIADIVDEDELQTGVRREGMYYGINGFFVRIAIAIQAWVLTAVLGVSGYQANVSAQAASAIIGLRVLVSPVVVVALLVAVAMMWIYPLHGRRLQKVKSDLAEIHRRKAEQVGK